MQFKITKTYDTLTPQLERLAGVLAAPRQIYEAIGAELLQCTRQTFGVQGTGRPIIWEDLSEKYKKQLMQRHDPNLIPTLLRSGRLFQSTQYVATDQHAEFIADCEYAEIHQWGRKKKGQSEDSENRKAERPFFPVNRQTNELTQDAENRVRQVAEKEILAIIGP